jgi:hypothetical protein
MAMGLEGDEILQLFEGRQMGAHRPAFGIGAASLRAIASLDQCARFDPFERSQAHRVAQIDFLKLALRIRPDRPHRDRTWEESL